MNEKEEENGTKDGDEDKVECKNEIENLEILLLSFFYSNACIRFEFKRSMSLFIMWTVLRIWKCYPVVYRVHTKQIIGMHFDAPWINTIHCSTHRLQNKFYSRVSTFPYAHSLLLDLAVCIRSLSTFLASHMHISWKNE